MDVKSEMPVSLPGEVMRSPRGFCWSIPMFVLMLIETVALVEVVFFDSRRAAWASGIGFAELYFWVVATSCVLQLAGILLVATGLCRLGGIVQIVASAPHAVKGEGLIGIIGGIRAYRSADPPLK
ncbi:MAG: hypothetical protein JSW66_06860 [Phycisphaerales bacterium]|nr:MAG: hypothetical protein JSW66_06860 [Phycisphaerales bacterium]